MLILQQTLYEKQGDPMSDRNRAQGWKHAKLSGHANEDKIENLLMSSKDFQVAFLSRIGEANRTITRISGGGLGESHVPSVFASGDLTTPKADMYVHLDDGRILTFSIKKSLAGQVYLVTIENFIEAFEKHFAPIPDDVKTGIRLYWGSHKDTLDIVDKYGTCKAYEVRKHRAVAATIHRYNSKLYSTFFKWFIDNAGQLAELCFARGGASRERDWAQFVWYKNELGETSVDEIFRIEDVCSAVRNVAQQDTFFGSVNGGSTIQLPFGFVQWHSPQKTIPGNLQFHHKHKCLSAIMPTGTHL